MVLPLLKKPRDDPKQLKNFLPISLLPYPAIVLESYVTQELHSFLPTSNFFHPHQAGLRAAYLTEAVMLSVLIDLKWETDAGPNLHSGITESLHRL